LTESRLKPLRREAFLDQLREELISPLLSNLYLNEVDKMLERAKEVTRTERWAAVEYARFADDLVIFGGFASAPAMASAGGGEAAPGGVGQTASGSE
jgi:hypothetical protein